MKRLLKTRARRGAAMLIALLVFFIAVLSGVLVLTMAASNAGRYTHEKDDQQAYLSVASAAKLILGKLGSTSVKFKATVKGEVPHSAEEVEIENGEDIQKLGLFFTDDNFQSMLETFAYEPGSSVPDVAFTLSVESAPEMGSVHVNIHVQGSVFYFRMYSQRGTSLDYQMTMQVATKFEGSGEGGNFTEGTDGFLHRDLVFNTDEAKFTAEKEEKKPQTGGTGA